MNIRSYLVALLFSVPFYATAATPQLPPAIPLPPPATEFKTYGSGLPLAEFLRVTIGDVLRKPYVLTPAVASEATLISADLSRVKPAGLLPVLRDVLDASGFVLREAQGVYIVDKKSPPEKRAEIEEALDMFVYAPKYRSVSALSSYFSMFPKLQFAFGAGISRQTLTPAMPSSSSSPQFTGTSQPAQSPGLGSDFSSGATAFSQSNGDPSLLVVKGATAHLDAFRSFIAQVDTAVPEVIVKAYVLEIRESNSKQSGVSLAMSILNDRLKVNLGSAPASGDSIKFSTASASVSAVVGTLAGDSRVRLVSSPVLRAADGSSASASIGTDTPTLGSVTTSNGAATQSITYQSAGVLLTIAPRVYEQSIRLKVSQEVSSFVQTDTGLSTTPTKLRRSFVSDVVAVSGDMVLLGGLSDTKSSTAHNRSLFFFGTDSNESSSSEIVVLLAIERA